MKPARKLCVDGPVRSVRLAERIDDRLCEIALAEGQTIAAVIRKVIADGLAVRRGAHQDDALLAR